jgi:hypothetical protein
VQGSVQQGFLASQNGSYGTSAKSLKILILDAHPEDYRTSPMADKKIMQSAKGVAYKGLKVFSRETREGIRQDAFQIPIIDSHARSLHLSMGDEVLLNFRVIDANLCDVM